jgi:hypothetical protein
MCEVAQFFMKGCDFPAGGDSSLRGTNGTHFRSQKNIWFVNLGKTLQMWGLVMVWSNLMFQISRKGSFVFGKEFLYFPVNLSCRIFEQG